MQKKYCYKNMKKQEKNVTANCSYRDHKKIVRRKIKKELKNATFLKK